MYSLGDNMAYVEIDIVESVSEYHDEVSRLLLLYEEWRDDFHKSMIYPIAEYFTHGGFYWIEKREWETYEESLEFWSDDIETIGFLAIDDWVRPDGHEQKKLDFLFILKNERRKGYASKAVTKADFSGDIKSVSTIQTPDGQAFVEAYKKRGIS